MPSSSVLYDGKAKGSAQDAGEEMAHENNGEGPVMRHFSKAENLNVQRPK
jgi:hypothetical protein